MSNKTEYGIPILYDQILVSTNYLSEISYGIEEEGVLYYIKSLKDFNPIDCSHEYAIMSHHGICIAITKQLVVVHLRNLKKNKPIFCYNTSDITLMKFREIGKNAARLLSCKPLSFYEE